MSWSGGSPAHPPTRAPGVLLTGVGKRYDIVSCFAALTHTVAADPSPLAPAQYAAHARAAVPLIDDPDYVPALERLCEEHGVGAVLPLTDLDIEILGRALEERRLPALVPSAEVARATYDKYEAHLLLAAAGPALAADRAPAGRPGGAVLPGDGQAPPRLRRALDPPRPRPRPGALLRRLRARADDGPARDERPGAVDRLPRRPRRALPERDPAHDARVAGGRVDQGRRWSPTASWWSSGGG